MKDQRANQLRILNDFPIQVEFRSDAFPPYEREEDEINPGRFGKRLAEFLISGLKEHGFEPLDPVAQDWGWVVPIKNKGFRLWIGCGNRDEQADSGFLCFIEPHEPTIRRLGFLWKVDATARVRALKEALDQVLLGNPAIRDKKWMNVEESN